MIEDNELMHEGVLRKSGRYPWGSGETPHQRNKQFLDYVDDLHKKGLTEAKIAEGMGISSTELRAVKTIAKTQQRQALQDRAVRLHETGMSNIAIGKEMGLNESRIRALLDPSARENAMILDTTANMLKDQIAEKRFIDIGTGVEHYIGGISKEKLGTAVAMLEEEGYVKHKVKVQQLGTGKETTVKVLTPPGTTWAEVMKNQDQIKTINDYSEDGGRSFISIKPPLSVNSKRVEVRYGDEGGSDMDGVIQVRRGVDDISLRGSRYAQVRIAVDGSHYLKGMAMYADDLPDGVDLRFNTNKSKTGNKLDAMKPMKDEEGNPFGAIVRQITEPDGNGGVRVVSAMNIVNEEGNWGKWSKSISSQALSKQSPALAKQQLDLKYASKQAEYDAIMSLTNPTVRKKLLETYSEGVDSASVHLKAAALPRQSTQVILPINSLKDHEIYAPNYRNGEKVVLIRYPHGGKFEIPELQVNNRNREAGSVLKGAIDAVGINSKVAARLSGADFDGDTVLVIPNDARHISTSSPLAALKGFDPQTAYPRYEGMPLMSPKTKQLKMGDVSNLITDMTIRGASNAELARAVKHSMVVIDAEKHKLNWRQSAKDNNIAELKKKYQGSSKSGASTLISKASSEVKVNQRKARSAADGGAIDPVTGKKVFVETGKNWINKDGEVQYKKTSSTKMAEVDDAFDLSSGTPMEVIYANHANKLKALANEARKSAYDTPALKYSPTAKVTYAPQVSSLNAKLNLAMKNKPLERQAQLLANAQVKAKRDANPDMDAAELKKVKSLALVESRARTGAEKTDIKITTDEWQAIQAGAISNNFLTNILNNTDLDVVKEYAMPREQVLMAPTRVARAKSMAALGYDQSEIADALGVSTSTLNRALNGKDGE